MYVHLKYFYALWNVVLFYVGLYYAWYIHVDEHLYIFCIHCERYAV